MISSVLYEGKLKDQLDNYLFSEIYIDYLITKFLFEKNFATAEETYDYLTKIIDPDLINLSGLKRLLNEKFLSQKTVYYLTEEQQKNISLTLNLKKDFDFMSFISEKELHLNISNELSKDDFNFQKMLLNVLILDYKYHQLDYKYHQKKNKEYYFCIIFYLMNNYDVLIDKITTTFKEGTVFYNELQLSDIINNEEIIKLLTLNNITTIHDLKYLAPEKLLSVFSNNLNELFSLMKSIDNNIENTLEDILDTVYSKLSDHALLVFNNRFNYELSVKGLTLEELGNRLGVTKERIRQIEAKTINKLLLQMPLVKNLLKCIYTNLKNPGDQFVEVDRLYNYLRTLNQNNNANLFAQLNNQSIAVENTARILLFFMEEGDSDIKYNRKLRVIYSASEISIDEIINKVIEKFGNAVSQNEISHMNSFERKVLNQEYRELKNGIFLKQGVNPREIYSEVIAKNFKNGYRMGSLEDYEKFKKECLKEYGFIDELPSMHSLQAMLERCNYVLIDKGTYLPQELCPNINEELLDNIINYIIENKPSIFYRSIFEQYKTELEKLNINNHYCLKGCLDRLLPTEFSTKRDYIIVGDVKVSSAELIINHMKSFSGEFELRDLKERFPGVKDYVFYNQLYNEVKNGLIWTSTKSFIYFKYFNIEEETIKELKNFVDSQFELLNTDTISSRKVYARLSLIHNDLLERLHLSHGQYTLFSLIRHIYPNYYYSRPLISLNPLEPKSAYALIKNHVEKYDKFNHDTVLDYVAKMNIVGLHSYLEFMDDMSDEYVQVNIDTMMRKESLGISPEQISQLKQILHLIFAKYPELDTNIFKGYAILPKMPVPWNKYLLVGIIRSYLDEEFEVKNKSNAYHNTDFVIRRLNHE